MYIQFISSELKEILKHFFRVTNISVSIYDTDHEIAYCNDVFPPYCSLVRSTAVGLARCEKLDAEACQRAVEARQPVTYTCHAGLCETVIPIFIEETHAGFLIFGQYLAQNKDNTEDMRRASEHLCIPFQQLKKSLSGTPVLDAGDTQAVSQLLNILLDGIIADKLIRVSKMDLLNSILSYISTNLNADLSSKTLCETFHISHSTLYNLFARIGQPLHAYIDDQRMRKAYDLLLNSELSLQEICDEINYSNYTYFIRKFRGTYGISPGKLRLQRKPN